MEPFWELFAFCAENTYGAEQQAIEFKEFWSGRRGSNP
jgi:hypothetical protein